MTKRFAAPLFTDSEIEAAFVGTNFGTRSFRPLLEQGVLSVACGYHVGHTLAVIMERLGLTTPKGRVTAKGRALMMEAFYDAKHSG